MLLRGLGGYRDPLGNAILELEVRNGKKRTLIIVVRRDGKVEKIYAPRIDMPQIRKEIILRLLSLREPILVEEVRDERLTSIIEKYLRLIRVLWR